MTQTYSVVIAEDQTLVRQGIGLLLEADKALRVVGEAEDGLQVVRMVNRLKPHLVLLNLSMPKLNGASAMREIKKCNPRTKIIALTRHTSDDYIVAAFHAGADGYCVKTDSQLELMAAVRSVLDGKTYLSPKISDTVLKGYMQTRQCKPFVEGALSDRETEILKLVAEGYSSPEIGELLSISSKTVDKHRANMMKKLNLHSAAALTAYAIKQGLVS